MDWNTIVRGAFSDRLMPEDDVIDELAQHVDSAYQAARAEGISKEAAERRVRELLGAWSNDPTMLDRRPRRPPAVVPLQASAAGLAGFWGDLRYAFQLVRRQWTHTLVVALTMALGIGASTVLFSVAYGVLVKPVPWPDADRLVRLYETRQGSPRPLRWMTNGTFLAWADKPATIESIVGWSTGRMTLTGSADAERVNVAEVTLGLLPLFGARASLGQLFEVDPARSLDQQQVVIDHRLWQEHFGGRGDIVGQVVRLDGASYRVAGVMAPSFGFPSRDTRAWVPFVVKPGGISMFQAIARLRPGITPAQAEAEANARGRAAPDPGLVVVAVFGSKGPVQVTAIPLFDSMTGEVRPALILLLVAAGLLLAAATANVASLQLARAMNRRREFAIRAALGAGGGRLARQLLVENALLGLIGGGGGLVLAAWLVRGLPSLLPSDFPRLSDIAIDWRVAVFAVGLSLAASILFGLAPALHAGRIKLAPSLAEDGLAPVGGGTRTVTARARLLLMAGQVAVAAVLLLGAAILSRSFIALISADRGYDPSHVLTARLPLPEATYNPVQRAAVLERVLDRLKRIPGVTAAAVSTGLPLLRGDTLSAFTMRSPRDGATVQVHTSIRHVSPGYFSALRLRIRDGRGFTEADTAAARPVIVVNRVFARQYLGDSPVGSRVPASYKRGETEAEVVGIVDDVRNGAITDPVAPELYRCSLQLSDGFADEEPSLVVRTAGDPTGVIPTLRSIVREQDASVALESVMTMDDRLVTSLAKPRLYAILLGAFAAFALAIAGVGLFGVLSRIVSLRAREIGVRAALGAAPADVVQLVLKQALAVTIVGIAVGLAASAALGRYVSTLLYGVTAYDAASYGAVSTVLILVVVVACIVPARRAANIDPARVLR